VARAQPLDLFRTATREWFAAAFPAPTRAQLLGWPAIARGESTLILAPTGSGKTLTAFLWCLNRLMFEPVPPRPERCRVLYVSPLKALAVDVERNLRAPLAGISIVAARRGDAATTPSIAIRTGDTPPAERAAFLRNPADILITTPESLFLMLTSNVRERLASVDTVIIDEIHALVPGKRGAHLSISLERLEALRQARRPGTNRNSESALQRIGLSATQRPLDEVARFLGGAEPRRGRRTAAYPSRGPASAPSSGGPASAGPTAIRPASEAQVPLDRIEADLHDEFADERHPARFRTVTTVDAGEKKALALRIEVPVEDMARLAAPLDVPSGPAAQGRSRPSVWASVHPRLLELIRQHRSTLIFVNSRRLAERLAGSLNDLAGEPLVRSHHGSLARAARSEVEDLLKAGHIRALVATSSLELGIDMGAIDLVVQIEAPPSVASGLQRIGRAGHQAGAVSAGVIFPKFRADLVACAAVSRAMRDGRVESTRYPRNPLDVLAQQVVAMAAVDSWSVDELFATVRRAAPYADLSRRTFDGVLDMLSGRYPSDAFAELRPRLTWDRARGMVIAREGAKRVAITNAGTIPDRGLYGVFLAGADKPVRVGELDEEMVFESQTGETFTLGASTWRIEEITHDRVLVTPAPGEPGKMPFWHGDQAGRPVELGYAIGRLVRELRSLPRATAAARLVDHHDLDALAAENLLRYLDDQAASSVIPDDRTIVVERSLDELGDWRVCLLSPLGSRIHAPWAMAATAHIRQMTGLDVEVMWGDEGFVVRFPETDRPPDPALLVPDADEVEGLVLRQLGGTSLFAARFREAAARALLLPRRRPGARTPLWQQRKRAADLLAVASRFGSFPILLETYREVLRDHFDMPALTDTLRRVSSRGLRVSNVDAKAPSPFAASLLFSYVANYIYDGDAPLAERRAQALSVDQAQLRELIGAAELRELLDPDAITALERQLQRLDERLRARSADAVHDLLLSIGDLTMEELGARCAMPGVEGVVNALERDRRILAVSIAGERRFVAVEDAARYRDALGSPLPPGIPESLLEPVPDPAGDLVMRYARTHPPFPSQDVAARFGLGVALVEAVLARLTDAGRLLEGEFRPGGSSREWVEPDVLRSLRRRSLARLRHEVEPVEGDALARFVVGWQGVGSSRQGLEALLDTIEQLQGASIPASVLERDVLPARVANYQPGMLDTLMAAGEAIWVGVEPLGERDGRIALYLTDAFATLATRDPEREREPLSARAKEIARYLGEHGASFFVAAHEGTGAGFPRETVDALWELVWRGMITNDTLHPLRAYARGEDARTARRGSQAPFRSRRLTPPAAEGRWSLVTPPSRTGRAQTEWAATLAQQLLSRHGVVTREAVTSEAIPGGFSLVYQVLKTMEDTGRVRRGYFVAGLGAAQFASPASLDLLRAHRDPPAEPRTVVLAATDPANPYGTLLPWPALRDASAQDTGRGPTRTVGATVVLVDGHATGYLRRGQRELLLFAPEVEPARSRMVLETARALAGMSRSRDEGRRGMLITEINGAPASTHPLARLFVEAGYGQSAMGLQLRPQPRPAAGGTRLAGAPGRGAFAMEETPQGRRPGDTRAGETSDLQRERTRPSGDRDHALDREGEGHSRGDEEPARGHSRDVDPDSASADVDRDDFPAE
jgi:ATP-dependent Lhr-like helicase